ATTFGGSNIDPTAWEDKKCKGESRFPTQVSVRAITPRLPLFLYNYTTQCIATTFGGSNIDPTAWEDKKCK
ncbi:Development/cell death domain-containing protein, partial [Cynara cardunculus var. scolymus]